MANDYSTYSGTATTSESAVEFRAKKIKFIKNDNASTGDLYISFESPIADGGDYFTLKPTESFSNLDEISCGNIYFKSSTGSVLFRVVGTKF